MAALLSFGAAPPIAAQAKSPASERGELVFFGTRADGPGTGITAARFDRFTGALSSLGVAVKATRPTWVISSPHRPIVYAVKETGNDGASEGGVAGFAVDGKTGRLSPISAIGSGGGGATFLTVNAQARPPVLLVANYGTGDIGVVPLGKMGALNNVVSKQRDIGSGASPRQRSAHPHGIAIDRTGRYALVSDLGADRIFVYRYDAARKVLAAVTPAGVATPPGAGPRHIVFRPDNRFAYANAELTGDVLVFEWDAAAGQLRLLKTVSTRSAGYAGDLSSAEIAVSPDGRFLYLSNRGEDVLLVFAIDPASGDLSTVQRISSGGKAPVGFTFDPSNNWLIVANEESNSAAVFRRDPATGRLASTGRSLTVADPTSVAFLSQ